MFELTISSDIKLLHRKICPVPARDIIRNEGNKNEIHRFGPVGMAPHKTIFIYMYITGERNGFVSIWLKVFNILNSKGKILQKLYLPACIATFSMFAMNIKAASSRPSLRSKIEFPFLYFIGQLLSSEKKLIMVYFNWSNFFFMTKKRIQ